MFKLYRRLSFLILPFLVACTTGNEGNVNAPEVAEIYTGIVQFHPDYFPNDSSLDYRIGVKVSVSVQDRQGTYDMEEVEVLSPDRQLSEYLLGGPDEVSWTTCFDRVNQVFQCELFVGDADQFSLTGWRTRILDSQGLSAAKSFSIRNIDGASLSGKSFVYSASYSEDTSGGISALEPIDQTTNSVVFENRNLQDSFFIEFDDVDRRAEHYSLDFYGGDDGETLVGRLAVDDELLVQNPINDQGRVSFLIPWADLDYAYKPLVPDETQEQYSAADVQAMHIILYDSSVAYRPNSDVNDEWYNYQSFSEYINLL